MKQRAPAKRKKREALVSKLSTSNTMKYDDITSTMRAFIGNREMVRRLGFFARDIYCQAARSARLAGALSCFLVIRTSGKEFSIECGPVTTVEELEAEYARVTEAIGSSELSDEDYFRIFAESEAYACTIALIEALQGRGIEVPVLQPSKKWS